MRKITLAELAELTNAECHGDGDCVITGVATLSNAKAGQISFLDNPRYRKYLPSTQASAVILNSNALSDCPVNALVTANPYLGYAKAAAFFCEPSKVTSGIHPSAVIGEHCQIHPSASIAANCVLGDKVVIGANTVISAGCVVGDRSSIGTDAYIYPNVSIYHDVQIGNRVIIHSGVVLGSDGFGMANHKGVWHKVPQIGKVIIGDDVEIGANTTIDRGALDDTVIEEGVKLDNQIQIAHNVHIGAHTAIAGCTGIAGSTTIGRYCQIGGGTGIAGHLTIADKVFVTGMSMVTHSIKEPGLYSSGTGILPNHEWQKSAVRFRQLDELVKRVRELEKLLYALAKQD